VDPLPILGRYFAARRDLVAAWLFGSVARGQARPDSDLDVAILLPGHGVDPIEAQMLADDIQADLVEALGDARAIDVVPLNGADLDFSFRVLRDGRLLLDADHRARLLFELQTMQNYWDFMPVIEAYRRAARERA
jgi:predicted nucleotidyltransferase